MGARNGKGEPRVSREVSLGVQYRLKWLREHLGGKLDETFAWQLGVGYSVLKGWVREAGPNLPGGANLLKLAKPLHDYGRQRPGISPTWLLTGEGTPFLGAEVPLRKTAAEDFRRVQIDTLEREGLGTRQELDRWLPLAEESLEVSLRLNRERCVEMGRLEAEAKATGRRPPPSHKVFPSRSTLSTQMIMLSLPDMNAMVRRAVEGAAEPRR